MAGSTFKKLGTPVHNETSGIAAGADILASGTIGRHGVLHVSVVVDTSTPVALHINDGTTDEECDLNGGVALTAGALYVFPVPVLQGFTYTLINATGGSTSTIAHASMLLECPVG